MINDVWGHHPQAITSSVTSINGKKLPALFKLVSWTPGTRNADIGAGKFNNISKYLSELEVQNFSFDPFNRSDAENSLTIQHIRDGQVDTVSITNTLNVIKEIEDRRILLRRAANALKPRGKVYIMCYEGNGSGIGKVSQVDRTDGCPLAWQENRKIRSYIPEIEEFFTVTDVKAGIVIAVPRHT